LFSFVKTFLPVSILDGLVGHKAHPENNVKEVVGKQLEESLSIEKRKG
jgi:hypothetical protein